MSSLFSPELTQDILARLSVANQEFKQLYPGESSQRQPVHVVYGGAHRFKPDTIQKLGTMAEKAFLEACPNAAVLAQILNRPESALLDNVYSRVVEKLKREAIEDFRIDFEDGFGSRPDDEEDAVAEQSARALAEAMSAGNLSPYIGLRIKSLSEDCKHRSVRTLDIFMRTLLQKTQGQLPENFVVTLPKITVPEQVSALAMLLRHVEDQHGLEIGQIRLELMMESPQLIHDWHGHFAIPALVQAAQGRCRGVHFGPYDYQSACSIISSSQSLVHPACDLARSGMQVALANTGIWLSDGPTSLMPIGPYRAVGQTRLTQEQECENWRIIHAAWQLSYRNICHALRHGFYQGWDLHPAQIPMRYVALYLFFLEGLETASQRLRNFMEQAAQATLVGNVFDDEATGQGLLNYFLRAFGCGAITESEMLATGLSLAQIQTRSFHKILMQMREIT